MRIREAVDKPNLNSLIEGRVTEWVCKS